MATGHSVTDNTAPRQMNITERSPKEEVISSAMELIDGQDRQILNFKEHITSLYVVIAALLVWGLLF